MAMLNNQRVDGFSMINHPFWGTPMTWGTPTTFWVHDCPLKSSRLRSELFKIPLSFHYTGWLRTISPIGLLSPIKGSIITYIYNLIIINQQGFWTSNLIRFYKITVKSHYITIKFHKITIKFHKITIKFHKITIKIRKIINNHHKIP